MNPPNVHNLRAYHLPDGEMFEAVTPAPATRTRLVAISEQDAEVLENVGTGLCKLGSPEAGMVLLNIVAAWRLVS